MPGDLADRRHLVVGVTPMHVSRNAAVDVSRLGRRHGHFSTQELWSVDEALKAVLGLD